MRKYVSLLLFLLPFLALGQKKEEQISLAFTNNHTAYPFASFAKLFSGPYHPGVELGYGFNWTTDKKHDWYQAFRLGYFYHRFVQHAIPLYTQTGYRYKPWHRMNFNAALGIGYMHSIPATAVLKMNSNGEYEKAKGVGRAQAILNFSVGGRYAINKKTDAPTIFLQCTQQFQAPFINSYVPLLPYNTIALGLSIPFRK
jgi:hypothetical protein